MLTFRKTFRVYFKSGNYLDVKAEDLMVTKDGGTIEKFEFINTNGKYISFNSADNIEAIAER